MPKGIPKTIEEKVNTLVENQDKLLEELELEKKARQEAEEKLEAKEVKEKKEKDPMSGPGTLCEVTKITNSESWQVPSIERVNPKTQTVETVPDKSKVPEGYAVRAGANNSSYIVESGKEIGGANGTKLADAVIPNCRSKYTKELTVYTKKAVQDRGNFLKEPPRVELHLCEKHEKMFGAKSKKQVKAEKEGK